MTNMPLSPQKDAHTAFDWQRNFVLFALGLTVLRIIVLVFSKIDLHADEAQYWFWSRDLDFGYYTKPPMIAWVIAATTSLFGNAEWAVRLGSPLLSAGTAGLLYALARELYDARTAFWAGLSWLMIPAVLLASGLISTDLPLLFFWSLALYAFARLSRTGAAADAVLLGAAIGLGFLSKYAMIYFPLGMALAFALSGKARQALKPLPLVIAGGTALAVFAPNIWWNAQNDFHTLSHTSANANWGAEKFNFDELWEFFTSQFIVAGPLIFGFFLFALFRLGKRRAQAGEAWGADAMLLAFAVPPLVIISVEAFISRANANWAMAAYPSLMVLVSAWMLRAQRAGLMKASLGVHAVLGAVLVASTLSLGFADRIGMSNSLKRVRNWEEQAADILAKAADYPAIVVDDRELMGSLLYYLRDAGKPIYAWDHDRGVQNHYEAFFRYQPAPGDRALLVVKYPEFLYRYIEFENILEVGESRMDTKVRCARVYGLYEISGYRPELADAPLPERDPVIPKRACRPY